jgi:hypothetical protein
MAIRIAEEDAAVKRANLAKKAEAEAARARRAEAAVSARNGANPQKGGDANAQKPQQRPKPSQKPQQVTTLVASGNPEGASDGKKMHLATSPGNLKMLLKAATAKRRSKTANATSGLSTPASAAATPAGVSPAPAARNAKDADATREDVDAKNKNVPPGEPEPEPEPRTDAAEPRDASTAATRSKPGGGAGSRPSRSVGSADTTNTRRSTRSASTKRDAPAAAPTEPAPAAEPTPVPKTDAPDMIPVTCGTKAGQYILSEKKVLFEGQKMAPAKFEELAALKTKRWKRNIKVVGDVSDRAVNIGEMLDILGIDTAAGVENPKHTPRGRTPVKK